MFEHMHFPMLVIIRLNLARDNGMLKWFVHWFRLADPVPCYVLDGDAAHFNEGAKTYLAKKTKKRTKFV